MKKILLIMLSIILLAGCSKPADIAVDVPNPKGYMTEPQILISSGHQYKEESWMEGDIELNEGSVVLQGDSFHISVIFQGVVSEDNLKEAIRVEGFEGTPEANINIHEGKTVYYTGYRGIESNKHYKLTISKDIADSDGKTLKADIQKDIMLKPDVTALYTLVGQQAVFKNLGRYATVDDYAVGSMNLTPDPKVFEVDFSAPVDQGSVEESIKQGFENKGLKYKFEWSNPQKLVLRVDGFKSGEAVPYVVSMSSAKDLEGSPVYGNLYFLTSKPNYLGEIDLKAKKDSILYKFPDKSYMTIQNPKINNSIILDDTETKYLFNMSAKTVSKIDISREFTVGIPSLSFVYSWLDSDNMLLLNKADGTVISYSTIDGSSTKLFTLPVEIIKSNIIEITASPDGSKIAVVYETLPPGQMDKHDFIIHVFDIKGESIYKGENQFMPRFLELFGSAANIKWLDNETMVLEDNLFTADKQDYNVISIHIKTGIKTLIAEHAFRPAVFEGGSLIKVESFKEFGMSDRSIDFIKDGKLIKSFQAGNFLYDNFHFSDENTVIYNENDKIRMYYIDNGKTEVLGNGYIIGLSAEGSKVFYMTNHKMLYYID
jgi:hypothetical protein